MISGPIQRRAFITLLGSAAAAWPLAARAQQAGMPVVGFLSPSVLDGAAADWLRAFRQGLKEGGGYVERENLAIEYLWAENDPDQLPVLAADLVRRRVNVIAVLNASTSGEIDAAFATFANERPDALFLSSGPFFNNRRVQLAHLATRYGIPAIGQSRTYTEVGGVMSYGTSQQDTHRQAGIYVGRILKGTKPADLPVVQSTRFEFVINHQAARTIGLTVPATLLAIADEVIE